VVLTHANVLANVRACCRRFGVRREDCLPALLPHHHAFPLTTTVVLPLFAGARMAVGDARSPRTADFLRRVRPTVLAGVPRVFESLVSGIERTARRQGRLAQLRKLEAFCGAFKNLTALNPAPFVFRGLHRKVFGGTQFRFGVSGGARLSPDLARRCFRLGIPLVQGWGMTELSPVGTVQEFSSWKFVGTRYYERNAGSIGTPLPKTRIRLRDVPDQNIRVERDGKGEMLVGGPQVMEGYHGQEPHGEKWLPTGDIARRDWRGRYWICGRVKHVIVLAGGKKVFPEEDLGDALAGCDLIDEYTVRAIQSGEKEKIGIIIKPDADAVREEGIEDFPTLYSALKRQIDSALEGKPPYMRLYDFCLTEREDGEFAGLVKNSMREPAPLKNPFHPERSWSEARNRERPLDLNPDNGSKTIEKETGE
jgi:long-chain acyl-CoA synthetase